MKLLKNIGTILAATAGVVWVIFKVMAGGNEDEAKDIVKKAEKDIKERNEAATKEKAEIAKLKGKALHKKGRDILNG